MFTPGTKLHSIYRAIVAFLSFAVPVLVTGYPTIANMTLGSLLFGLLHYAETKAQN
jgi:hypothetical protein